MNSVLAAAVIVAAGTNVQEHSPFHSTNVHAIYGKAIYNKIDVPFELIGYKKLFATKLNQAAFCYGNMIRKSHDLTEQDIKILLDPESCVFSDRVRVKLKYLIEHAHAQAIKKIKQEDCEAVLTVLKRSCVRDYNFTQWFNQAEIPLAVLDRIPAYVEGLNFEITN